MATLRLEHSGSKRSHGVHVIALGEEEEEEKGPGQSLELRQRRSG